MKAIILAAGRGSRMRDLTKETPKCLLEVRGKSLLNWQLEALRSAGIADIAIVTGYKREQLANRGLVEFHNSRWAKTNMVSSLACAAEWLNEGPCVVSYSDIFYSSDAIQSLINSSAKLAITYDPNWIDLWKNRFVDPLLDAETFRITSDHILTEVGNTPKSIQEVQGQYMGLLRIATDGWKEIVRIREGLTQEHQDKMHMTGTLQMVINANALPILAIPYLGIWGEIDSEIDFRMYSEAAGQ